MSSFVTVNGIPLVIGGNDETIEGTTADEQIFGTDGDDTINALGGNDFVQGGLGADTISGDEGDDGILGGEGDDTIEGGIGSDVMRGDLGADTFLFNPADSAEGADNDIVLDFNFADDDVLALSAVGIAEATPDVEQTGAALDASADYTITSTEAPPVEEVDDEEDGEEGDDPEAETAAGDVVINHPGGTITLTGLAFSEDISFAGLESAGFFQIQGLITGSGELVGTEFADVITAEAASSINGLAGDDVLTGSEESDEFVFDPSTDQGADTITNFQVPTESLGTAVPGDFIALSSEQVLAADPELPAADGDGTALGLEDLDASANWTLGASEAGDLLLTHPGGAIEFQGIAFSDQQFVDLAPIVLVDGAPIPEGGIPVASEEPPADEPPAEEPPAEEPPAEEEGDDDADDDGEDVADDEGDNGADDEGDDNADDDGEDVADDEDDDGADDDGDEDNGEDDTGDDVADASAVDDDATFSFAAEEDDSAGSVGSSGISFAADLPELDSGLGGSDVDIV